MFLPDVNAVNPSLLDPQNINFPEYSCVGKMCSPVPAEHIVGFSQMHKSFICIFVPDISILFIGPGNKLQRRMEYYSQNILFFPQKICDLVFPCPVHVAGFSQEAAVQIYGSQCIQTLKPQNLFPVGKEFPLRRKSAFIFIIFVHKGAGCVFIIFPEGILYLAVSEQVCVNSPWNLCVMPFFFSYPAHSPLRV